MSQPLIGAPRDRVDGPEKVTGEARYTADVVIEGLLHAAVVPSAIANGRIVGDRRRTGARSARRNSSDDAVTTRRE